VNVPAEQAETIIRHLGNGARIVEAARMALVPYAALSSDWTKGRRDAEAGLDTLEAGFYRQAQAERSRHIATARAKAQAAAGTRESADLLRYCEALQAEVEPLADNDENANAVRLSDHADPRVREASATALEAQRELLRALTSSTTREVVTA
jgi:hypothetical protein